MAQVVAGEARLWLAFLWPLLWTLSGLWTQPCARWTTTEREKEWRDLICALENVLEGNKRQSGEQEGGSGSSLGKR